MGKNNSEMVVLTWIHIFDFFVSMMTVYYTLSNIRLIIQVKWDIL